MKTLKQFSPQMEVYSIDEAFLDLSSVKNEKLLEHGCKIRETILKMDRYTNKHWYRNN